MKKLFKLFRFLKPYSLQLVLLLVLVGIQAFANLQLPDYMAKIVNQGIVKQDTNLIFNTGLWMLIVSLIGGFALIGVGFLASRIATGFARDLREKVFSRIESFSMKEFDKFSTASLITRTTNDIQQIQIAVIMILRIVLSAPVLGIGAIFKAYSMASSLSWIIALAVVIMIGLIALVFGIALPKYQILQKLVDRLNLVTRENLTGLRVIRAFNTEKYEEKKFDKANVDLTNINLFVNRLMTVMQPMMMLIFNFTAVAIIWFGAHLVSTNNLQIGDMIAFMQYAMQVLMSFLMISIVFIMIPRAAVSGERVSEVIDTKPEIKDPATPKNFPQDIKGLVEFKDVVFAYPNSDTPVLKNISFTARSGEVTAIIGSTGSGKSSLVNLIPRLYDVNNGQILVDGIDVREVRQKDLHNKIGYVPQKTSLFSGTVESNIKYGNHEASQEEVTQAASIAQATEFISKLEEQYNSPISQGGTNVSGGQKQRLSIARAIVRKPEIFIFDDSFSALDFKTDAALRKALATETENATVIIVTQRISTIINADKIIVLDEGQIVGEGTHKELIENNKVYKEIALSQLSEDELKEESI